MTRGCYGVMCHTLSYTSSWFVATVVMMEGPSAGSSQRACPDIRISRVRLVSGTGQSGLSRDRSSSADCSRSIFYPLPHESPSRVGPESPEVREPGSNQRYPHWPFPQPRFNPIQPPRWLLTRPLTSGLAASPRTPTSSKISHSGVGQRPQHPAGTGSGKYLSALCLLA